MGVPREVIEAAWREADRLLGTNATGALILKHFGVEPRPSGATLQT